MKVYNLTPNLVSYMGKAIKPNGGFIEVDRDTIPNRDLALQDAGLLAFGKLPKGWTPKVEQKEPTLVVSVVDDVLAVGNLKSVDKLELYETEKPAKSKSKYGLKEFKKKED